MSFEPRSAVPPGEAAMQPVIAAEEAGGAPDALRIQILATEHWSLLATRSMAWNEVFSRAGMLLSTLSGAIVALALVGQGSGFDDTFVLFGIVILPVVLFIGETTFIRMSASNVIDATTVIGMNRIRAGYLQVAPELRRYFVTSAHDDFRGVGVTMGNPSGDLPIAHMLAATPSVVAVINGVVAGAIVALIAIAVGAPTGAIIAVSVVVGLAMMVAHAAYGRRTVSRAQANVFAEFPSPEPVARPVDDR